MSKASVLKFAVTLSGYRLRLEGRGTMQQSRPAEAFVVHALAKPDVSVVVDLSDCQYLDSTFLGCLMGLRQQYPSQFRVAAPPETCRKLFGPTHLDQVLCVGCDLPDVIGDYETIAPESMNTREITRHIMECHRRLAQIPGPQQSAFAAIARQMERELQERV